MEKVYVVAHGTKEKVWYRCTDYDDPEEFHYEEQFNWLNETQVVFDTLEKTIDYMIKRAKESVESLRAKNQWFYFTRDIKPWGITEGKPVFYAIDEDGYGHYLSYRSYLVE